MIYGIGTDIVACARIRAVLERTGERFAEKILGPQELEKFRGYQAQLPARAISYLASRFAGKEAFAKALGIGIREPMAWQAVQILGDELGKPVLFPTGALAEWMSARQLRAHISLSDEAEYASAFAVVEKIS